MTEKRIQETIKEHHLLHPGQHIVIGLSGGPDSVCLFLVLEEMGYRLHPVHVNHQIREGAADSDQQYVEELCRSHGMLCHSIVFDCCKAAAEQGITTEEAGRNMRYQAFREEAERLHQQGIPREEIAIAVAHNADDQVETVLFRLLRGTGTDGLAGMEYQRQDPSGYWIVRPLLDVSREDILRFCEERQLSPCMDVTNDQPIYARNRIRLELIPELTSYNPSVRDALLRLSRIAAEDRACLNAAALEWMEEHQSGEDPCYPCDGLTALPDAVRHRVYAQALARAGLTEDLGYNHIRALDRILVSDNPSAQVELPRGTKAVRQYDSILFHGPQTETLMDGPELRVEILSAEEAGQRVLTGAVFDWDMIRQSFGEDAAERIRLRNRQAGDYLPIPGGRKKLQDLFVDMKVPRIERDRVVFAAIGRELLYLPKQQGVKRPRYNPLFLVTETTKSVIHIDIIGGTC